MKKLEMLKERIFEVKKDLEVVKDLYPDLKDVESYKYAYAIYIDNGRLEPVCGYLTDDLRDNNQLGFKDAFRAYLAANQPKSFLDFLFLVDAYYQGRQKFGYPVDWDHYHFKKLAVVDDILARSKGILLWHYQLEQLFGCFYRDYEKAVEARRAVNQKRAEVFDLAENLKFNPGTSLKDVIQERMVFSVTCYPNLIGAVAIFRHLT